MTKKQDEDLSGVGTTIVGGQPQGRRPRPRAKIPVGIEKVLYLAATEPEFRGALLRERLSAVEARGLELRQSEQAMLRAAPTTQLESAIDGLDLSEHNLERRRFMRTVAAAAVTLAAGEALSACEVEGPPPGDGDSAGISPDVPIYPMDAGGARPDAPEDDVEPLDREAFPEASPAGISPDVPEFDVPGPSADAGVRADAESLDIEVIYSDSGGARPDAPEDD